MSNEKVFDIQELLPDLDGGNFVSQLSRALADAALGTVAWGDQGKTGEVTVKFKLKRIGETSQVQIEHKLTHARPTKRGKQGEEVTTETPVYVDANGYCSIFPNNRDTQLDWHTSRDDIKEE